MEIVLVYNSHLTPENQLLIKHLSVNCGKYSNLESSDSNALDLKVHGLFFCTLENLEGCKSASERRRSIYNFHNHLAFLRKVAQFGGCHLPSTTTLLTNVTI